MQCRMHIVIQDSYYGLWIVTHIQAFKWYHFSHLEWSLIYSSRSRYYLTSNILKVAQDRAILTMTEWRHFQWPWTISNQYLKVGLLHDAEYLINGTRYRHSHNGILIMTYARTTQGCHFKWPWVTLSDLAIYSVMCWNIVRRRLSFLFLDCITDDTL